MLRLVALAILVPIMFGAGCSRSAGPEEKTSLPRVVYSNSFESPTDTIGAKYGYVEFRPEAAPGGGQQSAYVSGGCVLPHFFLEIPPVEEDSYLVLRCWGKDLAIGGSLSLSLPGDERSGIGIAVHEDTWTAYQSEDTLFCPANQTLALILNSGGFIGSAMLVDEIEVVQVARD